MLIIAESAKISRFADIEDSVRGSKIVIGERTSIDSFVKIKPAGGSGDCEIGDDTAINVGVAIYTGNGVKIGSKCLIAANTVISPVTHAYMKKDVPIREQGFVPPGTLFNPRPGIVIEDDVWIGANCTILEGARIGQGAVVTAGSVVKGVLEPYGVYAGSPLKLVSRRR